MMRKPKKLSVTQYQYDALQLMLPPEQITVSEWAGKYRMLDSKSSAIPGPWNNDITPYLTGVMDEFNNYETTKIIFVMIVNLCLVDSGDQTDIVYDFCATHSDYALPVKGSSHAQLSNYKLSKINRTDSRAMGTTLVLVDSGAYKDMIAGRMQRDNGRGSWMVYSGCDMEYAKQVTAEHKVNVKHGNTVKKVWQLKTSHADNHYLDTEVYNAAAADILGVRQLHLMKEEDVSVPEYKPPEEQWITENDNWLDR